MRIIDNIKLFNFTLSPGMGMLKEVERFNMAKAASDEGSRYYLVKKKDISNDGEVKKDKEEEIIPIYPMPKPFNDSERISFVFRSLFLPFSLIIVSFFLGLKNLIYASPVGMVLISALYLSTGIYVFLTLKEFKTFKHGVEDATRKDYKVSMFYVLSFFISIPFIFLEDGLSYGEVTSIFLNGFSAIVFIELIKKPALILLSDRIKFWYYHSINGGKEFWLVTSSRRGLPI